MTSKLFCSFFTNNVPALIFKQHAGKNYARRTYHRLMKRNSNLFASIAYPATAVNNVRYYSTKTLELEDVKDFRSDNNITIVGKDIPDPYIDLEHSGFPEYMKNILKDKGFEKPTIIQAQGWPVAMSGKNFVGIAQTGTGKTLAFLLPAILKIKENADKRKGLGPVALVLAPTRELARQIEQVAKTFERLSNIRTACIYGGASRSIQGEILQRGVDLVIATPGRLNDFLMSKGTNLNRCVYVVLDEADRMLDMGFEPQIRQVLEQIPLERQILMFSATWPKEVKELAKDYLGEFVQVNVGSTKLTANHNIQQNFHLCESHNKLLKLKSILHTISGDGFKKVLLFTNTKKIVDVLTMTLKRNGWKVVGIHGDKTQLQRDTIIKKFKSGYANILVATEVAARGLDVDGVSHVINYDFPNTVEDYVHRIGRTGRSDQKGVSHTILTEDDARHARDLIALLEEAKQEIPTELDEMARSFKISKTKDQETKRYTKSWNYKKTWNRNDRYDRRGYY